MQNAKLLKNSPPLVRMLAGAGVALALVSACSSGSSSGSTAQTSAGSSASGSASAMGAAAVTTTKGSLGTFLTDSSGRTLYLWMADTSSASTCYGQCAKFWPPLLTTGAPTGGNGVDASHLATTTRKDGTKQVTYDGHPLYRFAEDAKPGDTTGEGSNGFGAKWWVVGTDGAAITGASAPSSSPSTGGGGGYSY